MVARLADLASTRANRRSEDEIDEALGQAIDLLTSLSAQVEMLEKYVRRSNELIGLKDQRVERAEAERDEARKLAGLGCDANDGAEHTPMQEGRYTFCTKCGETITQPSLRERCRKAEAERDALKAEKHELMRSGLALMGDLKAAKDECDALKATVAEVLEPFAKAAKSSSVSETRQGDAWSITVDRPISFMDFRRASELHATLSGERK